MPRAYYGDKKPTNVDIYVGEKIKSRRLFLQKSQEELARAVGLTFQQIQKYERGLNRVSVGRLVNIGRALSVPLNYFFDEKVNKTGKIHAIPEDMATLLDETHVLPMLHAFVRIKDTDLRKRVLEMTEALADKSK